MQGITGVLVIEFLYLLKHQLGTGTRANVLAGQHELHLKVRYGENFMGNTAEDLANTSNLTEELVKSVKTESVDGGTKYTITFKEDQLSKILQDENGALSEFASLANTDLSGVTVDDIAESVSVNKDGYMTQLAMTFKMTVKSGSESGKMDVAMTLDVNNPGQDVTITLPDTSGAVEVTAEEMGLE